MEDGLSLAYATAIDGKYGGKFLTDHPDALIRSRLFHPVPVLTGFTKDEVTIWFTKCKHILLSIVTVTYNASAIGTSTEYKYYVNNVTKNGNVKTQHKCSKNILQKLENKTKTFM